MGEENFGIDAKVLDRMAIEIKEIVELGVEVGLVIGGGNLLFAVSQGWLIEWFFHSMQYNLLALIILVRALSYSFERDLKWSYIINN